VDRARIKSEDYLFHTVIDRATGEAAGRQALMRIVPEHGVIEIGNILWGPAIARTRVATEAFFLAAGHAFDELGYRRFEWKCNDRNEPSKAAALALRLHVRRRLPAAHGRQGQEPRQRVVLDHRPRVADDPRRVRALAGSVQLRFRGSTERKARNAGSSGRWCSSCAPSGRSSPA
jgi:hypothetical protein